MVVPPARELPSHTDGEAHVQDNASGTRESMQTLNGRELPTLHPLHYSSAPGLAPSPSLPALLGKNENRNMSDCIF